MGIDGRGSSVRRYSLIESTCPKPPSVSSSCDGFNSQLPTAFGNPTPNSARCCGTSFLGVGSWARASRWELSQPLSALIAEPGEQADTGGGRVAQPFGRSQPDEAENGDHPQIVGKRRALVTPEERARDGTRDHVGTRRD